MSVVGPRILVIALVTACFLGGTSCAGPGAEEVDVSGSSTVEPISTRVAELQTVAGTEIQVNVDGPGTGDGFELFCEGATDISDASRPIAPEEIAACDAAGVEFIELEVAIDGLSIVTNPDNEEVSCLSLADMYALMGPESGDVDNWSQAADIAEAFGSSTEFPDAPFDISAPGSESGTYDSFVELALGPPAELRLDEGDITEEQADDPIRQFPGQSDDNVIISGVQGSDSSFGWVGFAFAEGAGNAVREIAVSAEPDGDCIAPTIGTIADGTYPLSRSLYLYVNAGMVGESPALVEYVDYYLGDGYGAVREVGYVPLPDDRLAETLRVWTDREVGTRDS